MGILPVWQATLNIAVFFCTLIDLKQFNTILVLHDDTTRNEINLLTETLQPRFDVTWMLVNEFENHEFWKNPIIQHEKTLILTALQKKNIVSILIPLYQNQKLNIRSKNIIVASGITNLSIEALTSLQSQYINAIYVDWSQDVVVIHAWNPSNILKLIALNENEFCSSSNTDLTNRKYSGIFFNQVQTMQGRPTYVMFVYDTTNVYKVKSKGLEASIDGTEIRVIDLIGEALQSPMEFTVYQFPKEEMLLHKYYLEKTYMTVAPYKPKNVQIVSTKELMA